MVEEEALCAFGVHIVFRIERSDSILCLWALFTVEEEALCAFGVYIVLECI